MLNASGGGTEHTMGKAILAAARPPMWHIERGPTGQGDEAVRFGRHRIALADVAGVSLEEVRDRNIQGLILGSAAFVICATLMAYAVYETGAMSRFLIGATFLAGLAMAGLAETMVLKSVSLYEMTITLTSGERIKFTSTDRADIQALALRLMSGRGKPA